jgi:CubicO group peptidase (beta-lactamase class C family)
VRAILAAAVLAASIAGGIAAERGDAAPTDLDARLQAVVDGLTQDVYLGTGIAGDQEAFYVPGAALSVSLPGQPTRTYVAGTDDLKRRTPLRAGRVQPVGGGTKPMTPALIIDLVRRGKLRLDERLTAVARTTEGHEPQLGLIVGRYRDRVSRPAPRAAAARSNAKLVPYIGINFAFGGRAGQPVA